MCGICGILNLDTEDTVDKDKIVTMNDCMIHRGPDASGIHIDKNLGLGHRRLKIIDLEGGVQPMYDNNKNIVVVFNGEIYNFKEIRSNLMKKGYIFNTKSDTEVIIHAYLEYGEKCVEHFRGMFGIALYDNRINKLYLIRDRLGIKPIYYYQDKNSFIFSSEIKPILSTLKNKPDVNSSALDFYMSVGYVPGEETLFQDIKKLKPGHILSLENETVTINEYWDLKNTPESKISFPDALKEFENIAMESIELRLRSDVPLGAFLSGGLDSSVIVALMNKVSSNQVKTFSVGYKDEPDANELGYAKIVANKFKTEHHEFILEPLDFFNSLDLLLEHTEEPIVESAAVALYQLSKLAKEHVTVILSGEGGDEILAGYPLHQLSPKINATHNVVKFLPQYIKNKIASNIDNEKIMKYWDWVNLPLDIRYQSISNDVTSGIKEKMYSSENYLNRNTKTIEHYNNLFQKMSNGTNLRKMTYSDIKSWLPDDLLVKADKMTMAASLELRVPLLDHKLVEYCTALPDNYKLNGKQGKYLLKKFAEKYLPDEIIYRKKKGFPVPIAAWFRGELYEKTCEILLDSKTLARGYFKPEYIESILKKHKNGSQDLSRRIFSLLNLELWHRKYID